MTRGSNRHRYTEPNMQNNMNNSLSTWASAGSGDQVSLPHRKDHATQKHKGNIKAPLAHNYAIHVNALVCMQALAFFKSAGSA